MHKPRQIPLLLIVWLYAYSGVWILFQLLCRMLSPFVRSIAKQINGRVMSKESLQIIRANRNKSDQAVIFYCSSAGEYEQAKPLIDKMTTSHYVHIFFFSVSGYHYAQKLKEQHPFDLAPIDTLWDWETIFSAIRPQVCIMVRHEFWPCFIANAYKHSKIYAIDVSIREQASPLSLQVKRWLFNCLDFVFFVSKEDVQLLNWKSTRYAVAGNTKFERVLQRQVERIAIFNQLHVKMDAIFPRLKKLVIGSAWEEDLEVVLEAYQLLPIKEQVNWRIVVAPHDMEDKMIKTIQAICHKKNISCQLLNNSAKEDVEVLLIEEIGILFELYGCCDAALIGGGFKQGVHNIIEAAVYKIPMASGPHTGSDREAYSYQQKELLVTVADAKELSRWWHTATLETQSYQTKITAQLLAEQSATSIILKELSRQAL